MTRQHQIASDYYRYCGALNGLGDARPITSTIGSGLMSAAGIMAATGGPVGAVAGAITAAVGSLTILLGGMFKPDLTKIEATRIVDQIEAQTMKPLVAAWRALPAEKKTISLQREFVNTFDQAFDAVRQGCSNPALGTAGQNCISDRVRGGKWPWPEYYRDPIANDPEVHADPASDIENVGGSIVDSVSTFFSGESKSVPVPLLIGGALLLAWAWSD